MNDFLKNVIEGSNISPSEICLQAFNDNFSEAINVEWFNKKTCFEAIFYKNNIEHIARFSLNGTLLEYRQNLGPDHLPNLLKSLVLQKGEIMNVVLINKGNLLEYELIVRDKTQNRHLILLSDLGEIKLEKVL